MTLNLSTLTMNAGFDSSNAVLIQKLEEYSEIFDNIFVCDGNLTDVAKEFYSKLPKNIHVIDMPWDDSYVARYEKNVKMSQDGDWILHLDDDEIISNELIRFLNQRRFDDLDVDIIRLPCMLHITPDDEKYYPVEPSPKPEYVGQWTKNILYRKGTGLHFRHFGSHVIPENQSQKYTYCPYPYYHMKSLESFVYNDVWQAFLSPEGQQYRPVEAAKFKMFTKNWTTLWQFKVVTKSGDWNPALAKFAWDNRWEVDRPISRLAWVYYLLEGHEHPTDKEFIWEKVKKYVINKEGMELLETNKRQENFIEVTR